MLVTISDLLPDLDLATYFIKTECGCTYRPIRRDTDVMCRHRGAGLANLRPGKKCFNECYNSKDKMYFARRSS